MRPFLGGHGAAHRPAQGDVLAAILAELEGNGKLVSSWFLPLADPDQYLTIAAGPVVTTWAAAYGTQKVDLTEATNKPAWDDTLFGGKGGVVFDGTNDLLTGTGNVTNWPGATDDLYMIVAARQDLAGATAGNRMALSYGANVVYRYVGRTTNNRTRAAATASAATGQTGDYTGAHAVACHFDLGGTSRLYFDGVSDATFATTTEALTLTRVRMGALSDNTPAGFWSGAIVAAAVLNSTASVSDFLQLESVMRSRLI